MRRRTVLKSLLLLAGGTALARAPRAAAQPPRNSPQSSRWSPDRANTWYQAQGWLVGANYITSSAVNQLEMFQPDTFDPRRIDTELGWARANGLNAVRVFLHDVLLPRLDTQVKLVIASRHPPSLSWPRADIWLAMIRPLPLEGFSPRESLEYLARRGVKEPELASQVAGTAGGNPLALSLAADMLLQFSVRDFTASPEWRTTPRAP